MSFFLRRVSVVHDSVLSHRRVTGRSKGAQLTMSQEHMQ